MAPKITTEAAVESSNKKRKLAVVDSSTMIGDGVLTCALPHDIMLLILARLPVKSLCRFKCVCRIWRYLFSNPKFAKTHFDLFSVSPKKCSLQAHLLRVPRLGFHPTKKGPGLGYFVIDICRGLVCMGRPLDTQEIILWNPATNMWKSLPLSKADFGAADVISLGFGCIDEGDEYDYKVVRIFSLKRWPMKVGVEFYSSKSDSWQTIGVPFMFRLRSQCPYATVNGNPYWVAWINEKTRIAEGLMDNCVMLRLDLRTMSFKVFPMHPYGFMAPEFVDWKGCLGAVRSVNGADGWLKSLEVLVCDDATRVWRRAESFKGIKMKKAECLTSSRSGKIVVGCTDLSDNIFVFDTSKKCVVAEGVVSKVYRGSINVMPYDESLAFVKGMESMLPMKEEFQQPHQHPDENPFFNTNIMDGFFVLCREAACYYPLAF